MSDNNLRWLSLVYAGPGWLSAPSFIELDWILSLQSL